MSEQNSEFPIPEDVERQIAQLRDEYDAEFDRLDSMGIYNGSQITKILEKQFGNLFATPEQVEEREVQEIVTSAESIVTRSTRKRKTSRRRGYDPKGGVPPQHIADDVRRAQGLDNS